MLKGLQPAIAEHGVGWSQQRSGLQLTEAEWQSFVESQMVDIPTEIRLVLAEYRVVPFTTLVP